LKAWERRRNQRKNSGGSRWILSTHLIWGGVKDLNEKRTIRNGKKGPGVNKRFLRKDRKKRLGTGMVPMGDKG